MRTSGSWARNALSIAAIAIGVPVSVSAQSIHDVSVVLGNVSQRLEQYYRRIQNIICTEKTTEQPISGDMTPVGFARIIEAELRIESLEAEAGPVQNEPKVVRSIRKVNGRTPRPKDKEGCYDPNPLSTEPLAFLLAANREEFEFTWAGFGKGKDQNLMMIDFRERATGKPEVKEHERGREDCLSFNMPGGMRGRVYIDAATHDVVRIEERLISMIDFRVPTALQRRHPGFPDVAVLARFDRFIKYKPMTFDDPPETMLLPESIDELTIWRGGGSHRTSQKFSDYKRFLTGARIVK